MYSRAIDKVRVTDIAEGRARALILHRRRRIRKKWRHVLVLRKDRHVSRADTTTLVDDLRSVHRNGCPFTPRGERRVVRALKKLGHHKVRGLRRASC